LFLKKVQTARTEPTDHERGTLERLKASELDQPEVIRRKRKRTKGPNPLSCKKKKAKLDHTNTSNVSSREKGDNISWKFQNF
jgi:hypothetical protein